MAYCEHFKITDVKSFITLRPDEPVVGVVAAVPDFQFRFRVRAVDFIVAVFGRFVPVIKV